MTSKSNICISIDGMGGTNSGEHALEHPVKHLKARFNIDNEHFPDVSKAMLSSGGFEGVRSKDNSGLRISKDAVRQPGERDRATRNVAQP